jgi:hypothetical protein
VDNSTIPFSENIIPGTIYATNYDMGQFGYAYSDADFQNINGSTYNSGWSYRNDGVDIEACNDFSSNGYNVGWISSGEWLNFTIDVTQTGLYDILFNIAAQNAGGKILLAMDGQYLPVGIDVPVTGGWQNWQQYLIKNIYLTTGKHTLMTQFLNGGFNFSSMEFILTATIVDDKIDLPINFELNQNFPNPFNPSTSIIYAMPQTGLVTIKVYDILGKEIATLVNETKIKGTYTVEFDGSDLPSGIYIYKIQSGNFNDSKKMTLIR